MVGERLKALGNMVPDVAKPVAAYVPGVREGELVYTSGQLPSRNGELRKGKVGRDKGLHNRSAVGVAGLPLGACCEVEVIAKIK